MKHTGTVTAEKPHITLLYKEFRKWWLFKCAKKKKKNLKNERWDWNSNRAYQLLNRLPAQQTYQISSRAITAKTRKKILSYVIYNVYIVRIECSSVNIVTTLTGWHVGFCLTFGSESQENRSNKMYLCQLGVVSVAFLSVYHSRSRLADERQKRQGDPHISSLIRKHVHET